MTINIAETVRKVMGWCPNVTPVRYRSMQPVDFEYTSQIPSGGSNAESIQSKNVMFPANTSLSVLCFAIGFNRIIALAGGMDYAILIPIIVVMYSFFYFIVVKTFKANILIDENGVHFKSFRLRDFTLNYRNIKSVTPNKLVKSSNVVMAAMLMILVAMVAYFVISGEWQLVISIVPVLPWWLLVKQKQDRKYHDLDTQLYVEYENKKWYELTPYYSIVTDGITASGIQAAIEHYREAQ